METIAGHNFTFEIGRHNPLQILRTFRRLNLNQISGIEHGVVFEIFDLTVMKNRRRYEVLYRDGQARFKNFGLLHPQKNSCSTRLFFL